MLAADQRPHFGAAIERRPERNRLGLLDHRVHEFLIDRPLHQNPTARRADFALVEKDAEQRALDRDLEIRIGEKDIRRFAAEFQRDFLQRAGRAAHDHFADFDAAGERDFVDVGVCDETRAGCFTRSGDDVDDAGRQAGFFETRRQCQRSQRRLLGRFQNDGAAGADCRRQFPRRHQQRIVPRHDLACDANRLAQRQAHRIIRNRNDIPVNFRGETAVVLEAGGDIGDVEFGFDDRLAGIAAFKFGQFVGAAPHDVGQPEQHPAAILGRGVMPRSFVKRAAGGRDCPIDIVGCGVGCLRDGFGGGRIDDVERAGTAGWDERAVDTGVMAANQELYACCETVVKFGA